jgi:hypothetical protein
MDGDSEASLYVDDGGELEGDPLFTGSITAALKIVWAMQPAARGCARIVTVEWVYQAPQIERMRREDAGEL